MAETFRVLVEGQFVGAATSVQEGMNIAHQLAYRMGRHGGGIKVEIFDDHGSRVGGGSIFVA